MNISKAILEYLKLKGVDYVFGIPAGTISPIFDAMNEVDIKPIITKNEAGAAYCAARNASILGKLGVCFGAGAVGANNMTNGIADAMRAKLPVLMLTGHVNRKNIGRGALQELDTEQIFKPITKYSKTILEESQVMHELKKAIEIALTPPMGPVHLSVSVDIQSTKFDGNLDDLLKDSHIKPIKPYPDSIERAVKIINSETFGVILVGKGSRGLSSSIMELSEHLQWPVITTPSGKGVIPSEFKLNLGVYGFSSSDAAFEYISQSSVSCIIVLGSSLGESSTENFDPCFFTNKKIIHVDWDIKELGKVFETDVGINADLKDIIPILLERTRKKNIVFTPQEINKPYENNHTGISLRVFLEKLPKLLPSETRYLCDLGEFMNFVIKYLPIPQGGDFEMNIGYAAMGSSIGGSLGAYFAEPEKPVVVFAGDGCFFMNGMEILAAKEYRLPIIYIIINNSMLGFVEHGHRYLFGRSLDGFIQKRISICEMMKAAGIKSIEIRDIEDMEKIQECISNMDGPVVIEIITDGSEAPPIMGRLRALKK
ncbi:MAG TPA: thiamine pyrophosphate-binding protein [Pseudobacteroides sp.]|uniref:thiamine pyrophosphate-binding protein n=1 Tax=Pseudobacteroides sp. TaxID=1968840 RepID=UPI002F93DAA2